jgi:hypothetical protein
MMDEVSSMTASWFGNPGTVKDDARHQQDGNLN